MSELLQEKINVKDSLQKQLLDATIMMVDDEPLNMEVVKTFLEEIGYHKFVLVEKSTQALKILEETNPDILLLDLIMPDVSGFDILTAVRELQKYEFLPIIILTSSTDAESKLRALDLGATDFLSKPVDESELGLRVRNTLAAKAYQDQLAYYDPLTKLPNRELFLQRVEWSLKAGTRFKENFAILSIGVNNLSTINASSGPSSGDMVLMKISHRIKRMIRNVDVLTKETYGNTEINLFRTEGSGFSLILNRIDNSENAALVTSRILEVMEKPFQIENTETFISTSIGVAMYPEDGSDAASLLHAAASARDYAKNKSSSMIQFASDAINRAYKQRLSLESRLRNALEREEFVLHYQPKVDITSNFMCGAEVLLRWRTEENKLISPDIFIPIAEETGFIIPIGKWIITEACRMLNVWNEKRSEPFSLNINISVKQLSSEDFLSDILRIISQSHIDPSLLTVEITESLLIENIETKITILQKLKDMGLKISIDDFGTGYSSFNYLRRLPVDELKIDGSFISDLTENDNSHAIISSILYLSRSLGLNTVAEGVETEEQLKLLQMEQCNQYQGYLFSKPLPESELSGLLKK